MSHSTLTKALQSAGMGSSKEIEEFFSALLKSSVFIPLRREGGNTNPVAGEHSVESLPYLFIEYEEHSCIPVFSEEEFLYHWAEREILVSEDAFKSFIWTLPQNTWLYLNPNQDVGKEISPWEVELLKHGTDAIPDLVEGVIETEQEDLAIEPPTEELMPLTKVLIPILELYEELEEAYLLSIREADAESPRALVGIKYTTQLSEDKLAYIRSELQNASEEHLSKPYTGIFVVDDLGTDESINHNLFLDIAPFYKRNT
jgi:hypothetical protein